MADIDGDGRNNNIRGTRRSDDIDAKGGDDQVNGRGGNDRIEGGRGNDNLRGEDGDDIIKGGRDDDVLRGNAGNDNLDGGNGNDFLFGGSEAGNDVLAGGKGIDEFHFLIDVETVGGKDKIVDFDERTEFINLGTFGSFDQLDTNGDGELTDADAWVSLNGRTTRIDVGAAFGFGTGTDVLTVTNAIDSPLDSNDFRFQDPDL